MKSKKQKSSAVLIIESQPPHLGEYLTILQYVEHFDFLYVCLNSQAKVMPVNQAMAIWQQALRPFTGKIGLFVLDTDLATADRSDLPQDMCDSQIFTSSNSIFVRLVTLDMKVQLVPTVLGYHSVFYKSAYRQSRALDWLLARKFIMPSKGE